MHNKFHTELSSYVKAKDNENATRVILNELAISLIKDKEDFIEVLRSAGINVPDNTADLELIDVFVKNAPTNKGLLLGAALLINHRNQGVNFDGESEISDAGVKATYKELDEYFNCCGEEHSNAGWSDAIKSIADVGGSIGGKAMQSAAEKKRGSSMALAKQQDARKQMMQNVIASKQKESEDKNTSKRKQKKILIIAGASILGLVLIVGAIMVIKSNKGK
jgi:hypothetical protein